MTEILLKSQENKVEIQVAKTKITVLDQFLVVLEENKFDQKLQNKLEQHCSLAEGEINLLFPAGINEILAELSSRQDAQMLYYVKSSNINSITDKIAYALQIRINNFAPKKSAKKIVSYLMLPHNISLGIRLALKTCNTIWKYAGDTSTDFNFYSKRGILFTIYINAIFFYLNDETDNNKATDEFIKNSLTATVTKINNFKKIFKLENIPFLRLWF